MKRLQSIATVQIDVKSIESSLLQQELIDERKLWLAGFDDGRRATHNAIAANLFFGNKKLMIVSIHNQKVYQLNNTKEGFKVFEIGDVSQGVSMTSIGLLHPSVELVGYSDLRCFIKVTKNKSMLKAFRKGLNK